MKDLIPRRQAIEAAGGRQLELWGLPTKGYQPVAEMNGVAAYLRRAYDLFNQRPGGPLKAM